MASKKDKLLESAQRFVLKGQLDKAIKDYQQVVALDPNDVRYRQRLAELLVRDHRKEEAIAQYEDIGKHYADNSYFLKAIAIYKQVQRLSPGNSAVALTIASLNHQQGLTGNALAEYGQVAAQFEKDGALKDALKVVEKMLGVDAAHVATRLKHAELLFATGAPDAARDAFSALLDSLQSRGHETDAEAVAARMNQLFPGHQSAAASQPGFAAASQPAQEHHLTLDGFGGSEEVPGVSMELAAPWETEEPAELLSGAGADLPEREPEPADPFAQPFPSDGPNTASAFEPAAEPAAASQSAGSAWEEEIELDLDDDFPLEFAAPPDPATASPAVPEAFAAPAAAPEPVPVPAASDPQEIDLHLDFSVDLDFDEVVHSLDEEPLDEEAPDEEPRGVVELDLEEDLSLELSLPQESGAFGVPWPEAEPEEAEDYEEPEEWEEAEGWEEPEQAEDTEGHPEPMEVVEPVEPLEPLELMTPEELPAAAPAFAQPETALPPEPEPAEAAPSSGWDEIYPGAEGEPELDIEELESHYDLGIGYKEMGMYGGAIKEFDIAARNPQRRLDCLSLQALCYREKGEPDKAEDLLRRGIALRVLSSDERVCLSYELAALLEQTGDVEEAIELYREVRRVNPAYHDVSRRLSALSGEEHLDIIDLEMEEG